MEDFKEAEEPHLQQGQQVQQQCNNTPGDWLKKDQLQYFQVLKERKEKREKGEAYTKSLPKPKELRSISIEDKTLWGLNVSPDGRFVSYNLSKQAANAKATIVPVM
ncbi:MAG: hypothetical protein WDO71_01460 [Bacteroidota bacterium]